jgi:hypothetical protein
MSRLFLSFLILMAASAQAQVPQAGKARQIYSRLLTDFYEEILTMDAVTEPQEERLRAIESLKAAMGSTNPETFRFESAKTWTVAWPPKTLIPESSEPTQFEKIRAPHVPSPKDVHSIKDLNGYLKARLGDAAMEEIRSGQVQPLVLGGDEASLKSLLQVPETQVFKIPGLYESWGIKKYLVTPSGKKPVLAYLVPPAKEYLEHYQMMLTQVLGQEVEVFRSQKDLLKWKKELAQGVSEIGRKLGGQFDDVILGYYNQWPEILKGQILEQKEVSLPQGQLGRYFKIQNGSTIIRLLTLGHQKTIWGEASAFLLEGALVFRPRAMIFMGSAGSISEKTQVYQISAPAQFRTKQQALEVQNIIQMVKGKVQLAVPVQFSAVHGNTSSPASQTLNYLKGHAEAGVDTLDVEQSLIADMIARYNRSHVTKILFGAVNLITDKPLGHASHDLDRVDHSLKAKARLAAVTIAFESLKFEKKQPTQCGRVH